MISKHHRWKSILFNISPSILAVACVLLIVLLSVFAVSNYQREKELLIKGIVQKGLTLIRFINSNVRRSVQDELRSQRFQVDLWSSHMAETLALASEQPGVDFILVLNSQGDVMSSAGEGLHAALTADTAAYFGDVVGSVDGSENWKSRIITDASSKKRKFQLALSYMPSNMRGRGQSGSPHMGAGRMMPRFRNNPHSAPWQKEFTELMRKRPYFVVQLDFAQFSSPLNRQIIQIIILSLVIILVGVGGMASLMTLRGLKGSQLRMGKLQAFTDSLVSSLPVGLIATDGSRTIQVYNDAAQEIFGLEETDVLGEEPQACLTEEIALVFSGHADTEKGQQKEVEYISGSGTKRSLHLASQVVLTKNGDFSGEVLLVRDLTELKHLEREVQRNERLAALGKMAAGVAHELRNPLSSVKGLALLLKSIVGYSAKGVETAEILIKEVERLNRSIGELLDYAKPTTLQKEEASIVDILEKTKSLVEFDAAVYRVEIIHETIDNLPLVQIDKDKINQLFLNLYLNALQALPEGGRIEVKAFVLDDSLCVDLSDNGVGIAPEDLSRVLDPYFTTKSDGTGLGLSMSSKIVEEHGGRMEIVSKLGEFTRVRVVFPLRQTPSG